MSRPQRTPDEIQSVKMNIILKTIELFQREGIESISARKIGKEVGMTAANLYNYFDNMEEIIYQVQDHCLKTFLNFMDTHYKPSNDSKENLKNIFISYTKFGIENPDMYKLLFGTNTEVFLKNKRHGMKETLVITPENVIDSMKKLNADNEELQDVLYQLYIIAHGVVDSVNSGIMKSLVNDEKAFLDEFIEKIVFLYTSNM